MGKMNELDIAAIEQAIRKAVAETSLKSDEPDFIGNRPAFILRQWLKGVEMSKPTTLIELKPFAKQWYDLLKDQLVDDEGCCITFAQAWAQIVEVWDKVKHSKGDALDAAKARANRATYRIVELDWCDDEQIQYLGRVCYELSRPDGTFFLSGYDAAKILGKDQKTGRATLKMLELEKLIVCTKVGNRRKASEYKYIGRPPFHAKLPDDLEQRRQQMKDDLMRSQSPQILRG